MFKLIKRIICFSVIAVIVFFAIALRSGGEKFRWFGEKTGGAITESSEKLGQKADEIKGKKDEAVRSIERFTGTDKDEAQRGSSELSKRIEKAAGRDKEEAQVTSPETSKGKERKPEQGSAEDVGNETTGNSQHTPWDTILKKIMALIKDSRL